jgi:pyruvate dehydrogenase complex dehydrogenase (E1) component
MVSDSDRSDFSALRDSFGIKVSDKELFSAIFNIVDKDKVKELILETKKTEAISKEKEKIKKLEVKLKEKLQKLQSNQTEEKKEKVS